MNKLLTILQNKHTTGAGLVYVVAKFGCPIMAIWLPKYADQLKQTAQLVEGAAVFYGLAAAGDATKSATKDDLKTVVTETAQAIHTGDTSHLTKQTETETVKQ